MVNKSLNAIILEERSNDVSHLRQKLGDFRAKSRSFASLRMTRNSVRATSDDYKKFEESLQKYHN